MLYYGDNSDILTMEHSRELFSMRMQYIAKKVISSLWHITSFTIQ